MTVNFTLNALAMTLNVYHVHHSYLKVSRENDTRTFSIKLCKKCSRKELDLRARCAVSYIKQKHLRFNSSSFGYLYYKSIYVRYCCHFSSREITFYDNAQYIVYIVFLCDSTWCWCSLSTNGQSWMDGKSMIVWCVCCHCACMQ